MSEPVLRTERLALRPFRESDLDDLAVLYGDPEVMRFLRDGRTLDREETRARLERMMDHWQKHGFGLWALFAKESGRFVGRCGVAYQHCREPELTYGLARWCWGKGLATEAAGAALRYAFDVVGLPHVVGFAPKEHAGSQRVMAKIGMTLVGPYEYEGVAAVRYEIAHLAGRDRKSLDVDR